MPVRGCVANLEWRPNGANANETQALSSRPGRPLPANYSNLAFRSLRQDTVTAQVLHEAQMPTLMAPFLNCAPLSRIGMPFLAWVASCSLGLQKDSIGISI